MVQAENSRKDVTTSEDDAVLVDCVSRQKLALGYFGFGWYNANRKQLRPLAVVGPKGPVMPSLESVQKERYLPLSRPLFLYIQHNALQRRPELRRFVTFALKQAPVLVGRARSIPLSETTYRLVENKFYNQVLGTSFGGDLPVGLTISQALARSFDANKRPGFR